MQGDTPTILITGSTGNIGSELTRQLANSSSDLNLKAVVRSREANIKDNNSKNKTRLQQVVMDFDRPETIVEGLKNVDKLFLLTPTHPKLVEFTSNLVNEAKKAGGVKHIVKLSHIRADALMMMLPKLLSLVYIVKQKKSLKNQKFHIHFCVQTSSFRTLLIFTVP